MPPTPTATRGLVGHSEARYYDLLAWLLTLGRERAFRERLVDLARLAPGEAVLDVGCGTGTLALAAKRRVGATHPGRPTALPGPAVGLTGERPSEHVH